MYPVLYKFASVNIYAYGVMLAVAITVAVVGILRVFRAQGYPEEAVFDMAIIMVLGGLLGARIFYVVFYAWDYFLAHPLVFFDLRSGGLVFYGALLGGFLGFVVYIWAKHLPFWDMADIYAPYVALGYAIARIGCFLNGCCYGRPTALPWGVVFPLVDGLPRHPTQLYSSVTGFMLFALLYWLYPRRTFRGQVLLVYLLGYALLRFVLEFWRENLVIWPGLTLAQVTALAVVAVAAPLYLFRARNRRSGITSIRDK